MKHLSGAAEEFGNEKHSELILILTNHVKLVIYNLIERDFIIIILDFYSGDSPDYCLLSYNAVYSDRYRYIGEIRCPHI
jgi:hypothetical protein